MCNLKKSIFSVFVYMIFTGISFTANAAEVKNLRSGQDGKRAFVQFDLAGMPGEKEADVAVTLEVGGMRYMPDKLSLSGDFGKGVKVGVGRRIWWDLLKDMPAGFDGEIVWDVEAVSTVEYTALVKTQKERQKNEKADRERKLQAEAELELNVNQNLEKKRQALENKDRQPIEKEQVKPDLSLPNKEEKVQKKVLHVRGDVVVDARAGLMWTRNGKLAPEKISFDSAKRLIEKLNIEKYAGYSNWRLPTVTEFKKLYNLVKFIAGETRQPLDVIRETFIDFQLWHCWTINEIPTVVGVRWAYAFDLEDGSIKSFLKEEILYVLAVRG